MPTKNRTGSISNGRSSARLNHTRRLKRTVALAVFLAIAAALLCCATAALVVFPESTARLVQPLFPDVAKAIMARSDSQEREAADLFSQAFTDADFSTEGEELVYRDAHKGRPRVNPLVAQCSGIDLRSPIAPADLTGVLFHQSATQWGLVMTTQLPEANMEEVGASRAARVNNDQYDEGDWLDAEAMHVWRTGEPTDMDTSLDVGAAAGATIRAPVTGTVVYLRDYELYDKLGDVEIHIQPDGRPDLDVVLIHTVDPLIEVGDRVEAGATEIAHVRDIASVLTDVQLMFYTEGDDPGNHVHMQVNDTNYPEYREKRLEGAIRVE